MVQAFLSLGLHHVSTWRSGQLALFALETEGEMDLLESRRARKGFETARSLITC